MYEIGKPEARAVERVLMSKQLFRYRGGEGGECDKFESELGEKLGCNYVLTVNQGTAALICGLVGLDIGPGDEVIVPGYTFMASPLAAVAVGAVPIIAEVDESLTIDPADVERKITKRTKAIMPVHMMGLPSKMDELKRIAKRHRVSIIEDACQAIGGSYRGKSLGTIGRVGAFSFNQFKIIGCGDSGAVLTSEKEIYEKARIHHDGGCIFRTKKFSMEIFCGWGFRVSEIQGAILRQQLKRLARILRNLRSRKSAMYEVFAKSSACSMNEINCREGDCGIGTAVMFENEARMRRVLEELQRLKVWAFTPIDTDRHVYSNWKPILKQMGSSHPRRDAFKLAGKKYHYTKDMCPRTLDILSRTIVIHSLYDKTVGENAKLARQLRAIIEKAT